MGRRKLKPSADDLAKAFEASKGNLTNAAKLLGVTRVTVYNWMKEDEDMFNVMMNSRKALLDKCISTAQLLAMGIPKLDDENRVVGWIEKPDGHMLRYFMSTLGKDEGFGESVSVRTDGAIGVNLFKTIPDEELGSMGEKFDELF